MRKLRVLLACECSGRVRDEFAKLGWEAWSADILPSETLVSENYPNGRVSLIADPNTHHYQGDVRDLFRWDHMANCQRAMQATNEFFACKNTPGWQPTLPLWDLSIGFPPCTDLAFAGAMWFKQKQADGRQQRAMDFFMEMVDAPSPLVAVENPRGVPFTQYRRPDQLIHPWMFGDPFKKATCLWLKGLPLLVPEITEEPAELNIVVSGGSRAGGKNWDPSWNKYEDGEGRKNRAKTRSRTFPGIARAMAQQWSEFAQSYYGG